MSQVTLSGWQVQARTRPPGTTYLLPGLSIPSLLWFTALGSAATTQSFSVPQACSPQGHWGQGGQPVPLPGWSLIGQTFSSLLLAGHRGPPAHTGTG